MPRGYTPAPRPTYIFRRKPSLRPYLRDPAKISKRATPEICLRQATISSHRTSPQVTLRRPSNPYIAASRRCNTACYYSKTSYQSWKSSFSGSKQRIQRPGEPKRSFLPRPGEQTPLEAGSCSGTGRIS